MASSSIFPEPGKQKRELFLGRMNPPHNGHVQIIKNMKNPLVVLIKGKKSSNEKERNPFSEDYQIELLHKVFPSLEISVAPNGFLPGILGFFRKKGIEITKIYTGEDRIQGYKSAIDVANEKMEPKYHYNVIFEKTPRITSATKVRAAIKNNDLETFKKNMPSQFHDQFNKMKTIMMTAISEENSTTVHSPIISFKDFLINEGGNVQITTPEGEEYSAERINLKKLSRSQVVKSLKVGLDAINSAYSKFAGIPLWNEDVLKNLDHLSGSAKWFFDLSSIEDTRFSNVKPSVGDIDLQVDGSAIELIKGFLDSLSKGTKLGTLTYIGMKFSVDQFITLWETDFGQNLQIDWELVEYIGGKPSKWSKFSHSSAWVDLEKGIKGLFSKYLFRSLTAKESNEVIILKGKKGTPKKETVTKYVASLKGLRERISPVIDPDTSKQKVINGLLVYTENPSKDATYITDLDAFFSLLFDGKKATSKDLEDLNSFVGMVDVVKRYTNSVQQNNIVDRFVEILFGKGAQKIYRGRENRLLDFRDKTTALKFICSKLGIEWNKYTQTIRQYYKSY